MPTSSSASTTANLSTRTLEILQFIDDTHLRLEVETIARIALESLHHLGRIHLPQDHFEENLQNAAKGLAKHHRHIELAPYVLRAIASINQLLFYLVDKFPNTGNDTDCRPSDDAFDLEFDLVDGPTGEGSGLAKQGTHDTLSPRDQVADAAYAFGSMLRSRVLNFSERLRFGLNQDDDWQLLAELDDNKRRLTKAVQGLLFGVLGVFNSQVRREEILPEYRSAVSSAVSLRGAISDLTYHITRFNDALAKANLEQTIPLIVAVSDHLARFAARPEYRTLRADDKRAIIDFRTTLYELRKNPYDGFQRKLVPAVEGFSKFLESMAAINHREVLVLHDQQRIDEALLKLQLLLEHENRDFFDRQQEFDAIVTDLVVLKGRNPELDFARKSHRPQSADEVEFNSKMLEWLRLLENVQRSVN